uniref:Macro domain-containing protein n=2 Tax=Stomoxys calcitrans TaxID=35570 RepID=A0A1I8NP22_STOCA
MNYEMKPNSVNEFNLRKMSNSNYKLTEVDGDLFNAPSTHSLAHCVAADLGMNAGIAVKFKPLYGQVDQLKSQGVKTGGVAVLNDNKRFIYYLVTKDKNLDKPTYESLKNSLYAMRDHMITNHVQNLAMPHIGCGIDGLEWEKVSAELERVFANVNVHLVVYNFVPK